ncbi:MAG: prolipoprotein diacylglyceryl transferase family protein, partial [Chloroflexota bacterium]|nr:prolipoprotein diacylglyceryl transferase family protein [Chloroflexota bacterium]
MNIQNPLQFLSLFSIITTAGAILGLTLTAWRATDRKMFYIDAGISVTFGALLGARAGFVLRNWGYFQNHAPEIPQIWLGGLAWPGAVAGAFLVLVAISLAAKHHLGKLADALLPLLGTLAVSLWLANWLDGNTYGPLTNNWWGIPISNQFGEIARRWPLSAFGAILSGVLVFGAEWARGRWWSNIPGRGAILATLGLSLTNLVISLLRVNPAPCLWGLRWESWFAILIAAAAAVAF